jgi:hypothetical protein
MQHSATATNLPAMELTANPICVLEQLEKEWN